VFSGAVAGKIVAPEITFREGVVGGVFAGQHAFVERHPDDHADAVFLGRRQKLRQHLFVLASYS